MSNNRWTAIGLGSLSLLTFVAIYLLWDRSTPSVPPIANSTAVGESSEQKSHVDGSSAVVDRIPFRLTDANNISIDATINGSDPLPLMFHTAEDSVVLTKEAVTRMKGFHATDSIQVESWGGMASSGFSKGNLVTIGKQTWKEQTIFVDEHSGPETDGKFGPNLFGDQILEINFDLRELIVHTALPASVTDPASAFRRLSYTVNRGNMFIQASLEVDGQKRDHSFLVHSGFGGTALLDDAFVEQHELGKKFETISERELRDSFGNRIKTKKVKVGSFDVGEVTFTDIPVELFEGSIGRQKLSVLGADLLKRFNVVIDPMQHHLYLAPNSLFSSKYPS